MDWKKTLILVGAIDAAVLLIMAIVFAHLAVSMAEREVLGVRSVFPAGGITAVASAGWEGYAFPHRMRFLARRFEHTADLWGLLRRAVPETKVGAEVPIGDGGLYAIRRRAKGYVLYAVFRLGERVLWLDMVSSNSTLDHAKRAFDECLCRMQAGGKPIAADLREALAKIDGRISPFFIQSPRQMLLMLGAVFVLVFAFIFAIMRRAGLPPRSCEGMVLCTPFSTMTVRRGLSRSSMPCCLCLEGGRIVAYRFRRPVLTIDLNQARGKIFMEKNKIRYEDTIIALNAEDFQKWRMMAAL